MSAPVGRILLPDPVSAKGLISLAKVRRTLGLQEILDPLQVTKGNEVSPDSLTAHLVLLAASGSISLYVPADPESKSYQIDPVAIREGRRGFLLVESIAEGHFAVVRSLMFQGSLEVQAEGQPILVREPELYSALKIGPTAQRRLVEVVREVIELAKSQGVRLTNKSLLERVRRYGDIRGISDQRILEVAGEIKPKDWSKPGPRSGPRRTE